MKIDVVDGFKMLSDVTRKPTLIVESDRLDDCMRFAVEKKITRIYLQNNYGFNLLNVDFLKDFNFFTEISIIKNYSEIDVSGVQFLKQLVRLTLSNGNQGLDFGSFPYLENASVDWNNKLNNLHLCKKLNKLILWKYKPKTGSFQELSSLSSLKSLKITQSNLSSLSGLEGLGHLEEFEAYYFSKLENLAAIGVVNKSLKSLILENCKKIRDYEDALSSLENLQKLILGDCGPLNNLKFINRLKKLNFFSFVGTNITDGDLSLLLKAKIEYVGFDDKRHYSHKMKDVNPTFRWDQRSDAG